jgi:rRNA maturation RNase YbeY
METNFHFQHACSLTKRNELKCFLHDISKKEKTKIELLDVIFCDDDYLHHLNVAHLNHDTLTDIITFDLTEPNQKAKTGELYISIIRVKENASLFHTTFKRELHRVIFHGLLHLCGYKDKSKSDIAMMRSKEEFYLDRYFKS